MSDHPSLFDPSDPPRLPDAELGARLRDAAIERVGDAAPDPWWTFAAVAIRAAAARLDELTTDDVWVELERLEADPPPEPRAMGAAMRAAQRDGLIVPTDRTRPTVRPEAHRNPKRVWRVAG